MFLINLELGGGYVAINLKKDIYTFVIGWAGLKIAYDVFCRLRYVFRKLKTFVGSFPHLLAI